MARRIGEHAAIAVALAVLIVGEAGRLLTGAPVPFLLLSMVALAGMALANILMPSLVRRHYPDRIGLATALYSLVLTIGVTSASMATVPIAQATLGWRGGLAAWVVTAVAALLCWVPLLRAGDPRRTAAHHRVTLAQVARTRLGWALAVFFGIQSAQAYSIFGWLPSVYRSAGIDEVQAGLLLGIATGVGIVPAFLIPAYVARTGNPSVLFVTIIAFLVTGYLGLLIAPTTAPWLWAVCLALGTASFPLLLALFGTRAATPAATAALSGFGQSVGYLIATLGPLSFGVLHAATGGWTASIMLQLVLIVPMLIAGLHACRPQLIEDQIRD
ncbi:MFS transporter [Tessaracoccus sp. HDW20]|uniref:MFS transporter n=1 Tax=Tessaracoccus coleopterorum TaxID=2714950 RepID=UPI0018D2B1CD|nr:MFS transporter [Tessaracoccus coleopterorum]